MNNVTTDVDGKKRLVLKHKLTDLIIIKAQQSLSAERSKGQLIDEVEQHERHLYGQYRLCPKWHPINSLYSALPLTRAYRALVKCSALGR